MSIHYSFRFEVDSEELNIKSCEEETLQKFFSKKSSYYESSIPPSIRRYKRRYGIGDVKIPYSHKEKVEN